MRTPSGTGDATLDLGGTPAGCRDDPRWPPLVNRGTLAIAHRAPGAVGRIPTGTVNHSTSWVAAIANKPPEKLS